MIVAMAIGLALAIQQFFVKPYQIPTGSMQPTLELGERVLVNRFSYDLFGGEPEIGDIVVFHPPVSAEDGYVGKMCPESRLGSQPCPAPLEEESDENFIKRVVAGPGDVLYIEDGHPVVNGEKVTDEPYIAPCRGVSECDMQESITIPPDHYFMMGDNRGQSKDSRFWGPVPRDWIIGQAFFSYWPPNEIGIL